MMRRKVYGEYRIEGCPFCGKTATLRNSQGIPCCITHSKETLENMKCACGSYLDIMQGKFGTFFTCINCGNVSFAKGLEMNGYPLKSIEDL